MSTTSGFIDLDRRFRELDPRRKSEDAALDSYSAAMFGREPGLGWKELLERRLVVILGEPGSGKTREFKERANLVQAEGQDAFFIRLDALATGSLQAVLTSEDYQRFQKWRRSDATAIFFLDSVDEAKFRKPNDFVTALDRLRDVIGSSRFGRIKLVVSSRISEWRAETDATALRARFPLPPLFRRREGQEENSQDHVEPDPDVFVVQIEPLDPSRVEKFVREKNIPNPAGFIEALDKQHAWEFTRRPLDVVGLANYWTQNNQLGSLTELIEHDLRCKLSETEERARLDPLTEQLARTGAETLAAAVIFSRCFHFRVPDDAHLDTEGALDAAACLPDDWRPEQCRALLERAVFDSAAYGRIRFHSRRIAEYLAARWIAKRMDKGCPATALEDLLFKRKASRRVVRQSLAPVVAWLCCGEKRWNAEVREWALEAAPSIHLKYGDPNCLPLEYKRRVFQSLLEYYKGRERIWIEEDAETLSRLADPNLANDISEIIRNSDAAVDLRRTMLLLIRHGRLVKCLEAVLEIVAAPTETDELKLYAIVAIRDIGLLSHRRRLAEITQRLTEIPNSWLGYLCEALFPDVIYVSGLAGLIGKTSSVSAHSVSLPYHLNKLLEEKLPTGATTDLLSRLVELAETPPHLKHADKTIPISVRFGWIGKVIPTVLTAVLRKSSLTPEEAEPAAHAVRILGLARESGIIHSELPADLNEATNQHPAVRRCYCWHRVDECRRENEKGPTSLLFWIFRGFEGLRATTADLEWLLDDIINQSALENRKLALQFAIDLWINSGCKRKDRCRIRRAASSEPSLLRLFDNHAAAMRWLWFRRLWQKWIGQNIGSEWWWQRRRQEARDYCTWLREEWALIRHLKKLSSGQYVNWLAELAAEAAQYEGHSQLSPRNWNSLKKKRGSIITNAARNGCKRAWQKSSPFLPHEKPKPSAIYNISIVGLAGLQTCFNDDDVEFHKLSEDEARLAARYATNELNGFPPWFIDLAKLHPKAVGDVLVECIRGEWEFPLDREHVHEVLADLVWHGDGLMHLVKEALLGLLLVRDPSNDQILRYALALLANQANPPRTELIKLAEQRTEMNPEGRNSFILWLAIWIQLDAGSAIRFIQKRITGNGNANTIVIRLCGVLGGDRGREQPLVPDPDYVKPIHLRTFIPLVYGHVMPGDDIAHAEGRMHSLTGRDYAQSFRNGLLTKLSESEDPDADIVLRDMAKDPALAHLRDWILSLVDRRDEQRSDAQPWIPRDVRTFERDYEIDPKTDYDLYKIACRRLEELKHDVEQSDNSLRDEIRPDDIEAVLRKWLARKLRERSRDRYTVPQEEEIDQQQRPDLRIQKPGIGPVSVEVKFAERWTLPELLEGLEKQLAGQYLRAHDSRYGIYLVGYSRTRRWESVDGSGVVSFEEVLQKLEAKRIEILQTRADVADIAVIGIDFRDPR